MPLVIREAIAHAAPATHRHVHTRPSRHEAIAAKKLTPWNGQPTLSLRFAPKSAGLVFTSAAVHMEELLMRRFRID
jgi:hypothetical protein